MLSPADAPQANSFRKHLHTGLIRADMSPSTSTEEARAEAEERLKTILAGAGKNALRLKLYRDFLKLVRNDIKDAHRNGMGGIEVCVCRSALMDVLINDVFHHCLEQSGAVKKLSLIHI